MRGDDGKRLPHGVDFKGHDLQQRHRLFPWGQLMIQEFLDSHERILHDEFQQWRTDNPDGFCLNFKTKSRANLHVSTGCMHLGGWVVSLQDYVDRGIPQSLTKKRKVCSPDLDALIAWAETNSVDIVPCRHCIEVEDDA